MTVRTDVSVAWHLSPRIITVAAPSTEIVLQDLHDTLRALEDDEEGQAYDILIDSAGKENLGGGVTVGITATLLNAQLAFEARLAAVEEGTVTTPDTLGLTLTDSAATFQTNGIKRGDVLYNQTDDSKATVLVVTDETHLIVDGLQGGATNQFNAADAYEIYAIDACSITGGNLVAVDDVGADLPATLPTFGTQIVRTSSSSATVQNLAALEYSTFGGGVTVDVTSPYSLSTPPTVGLLGTLQAPVNNLTDALAIAQSRSFNALYVVGSLTVNGGLSFDGFLFQGASVGASVNVAAAASVVGCEFKDLNVTGTLDGNSYILHCFVSDLTYINGRIEDSGLAGTITLGGGAIARIINCRDSDPSASSPIIDMGGAGQELEVRGYFGAIEIRNKTGVDPVAIDLQGRVIIHSTVTNGIIRVRGIGHVEDSSTGTTVNQDDLITRATIADAVHDDPVEGAYTQRQLDRLIASVLFGKATEVAGVVTYRDPNDIKDRVAVTHDASGNRTVVVLDAS